jgi:hypothetical protein
MAPTAGVLSMYHIKLSFSVHLRGITILYLVGPGAHDPFARLLSPPLSVYVPLCVSMCLFVCMCVCVVSHMGTQTPGI